MSLPDWEMPQNRVVALPRCDHTQMDPSYLWSGPVTEHTYKTAFHPLRLPVLSVLCPGRFYRLGWIYDCDAAVALKPARCDRSSAHLRLLAVALGVVMCEQGPVGPVMVEWRDQPSARRGRHHGATGIKGVLIHRYRPAVSFTHTHTHTHTEDTRRLPDQLSLSSPLSRALTCSHVLSRSIPNGMTYSGRPLQIHSLHSCTCKHKHTLQIRVSLASLTRD